MLIVSEKGKVIDYFNRKIMNDTCGDYGYTSIKVDSLGYVAIGCKKPAIIVLFDSESNYVTQTNFPFKWPINDIKIMSKNRLAIVDDESV